MLICCSELLNASNPTQYHSLYTSPAICRSVNLSTAGNDIGYLGKSTDECNITMLCCRQCSLLVDVYLLPYWRNVSQHHSFDVSIWMEYGYKQGCHIELVLIQFDFRLTRYKNHSIRFNFNSISIRLKNDLIRYKTASADMKKLVILKLANFIKGLYTTMTKTSENLFCVDV